MYPVKYYVHVVHYVGHAVGNNRVTAAAVRAMLRPSLVSAGSRSKDISR